MKSTSEIRSVVRDYAVAGTTSDNAAVVNLCTGVVAVLDDLDALLADDDAVDALRWREVKGHLEASEFGECREAADVVGLLQALTRSLRANVEARQRLEQRPAAPGRSVSVSARSALDRAKAAEAQLTEANRTIVTLRAAGIYRREYAAEREDTLSALRSAGIETADPAAGVRELAAQRDRLQARFDEYRRESEAQPPSDKAPTPEPDNRCPYCEGHGMRDVHRCMGCDGTGSATEPAEAEPSAPDDPPAEVLSDLLGMVMDGREPSPEQCAARTPAERMEAERWAAAVHLDASDNDGIVIPPKPTWLVAPRTPETAEPSAPVRPACPGCDSPLSRVTQSPGSALNRDQFDAVKAGDWYCERCPSHPERKSAYGVRYWWDHELAPRTPETAEPDLCNAGSDEAHARHLAALEDDAENWRHAEPSAPVLREPEGWTRAFDSDGCMEWHGPDRTVVCAVRHGEGGDFVNVTKTTDGFMEEIDIPVEVACDVLREGTPPAPRTPETAEPARPRINGGTGNCVAHGVYKCPSCEPAPTRDEVARQLYREFDHAPGEPARSTDPTVPTSAGYIHEPPGPTARERIEQAVDHPVVGPVVRDLVSLAFGTHRPGGRGPDDPYPAQRVESNVAAACEALVDSLLAFRSECARHARED